MKLQLNGEEYHTESETLLDLLEELRIAPGRVAVEINLKVIKRADVSSCRLRDGDAVEIVNFVGGGSELIGTGRSCLFRTATGRDTVAKRGGCHG